jgi:hypothetical protein
LASPLAAIAAMTLTAACGGSSAPSATHAGAPSSERQARSATAPVVTTGRACTTAELTAVFLGQDGATGDVVLSFALRNRGSAICHTYGWPGVKFVGAGGQGLTTRSRRVTSDILGSTPASLIALAPGRWASFRVVATDQNSNGGTAGCEMAHALQIIAPDDTGKLSVGIPGGAYECSAVTISALQPGDTADS